MKQHRVLSVTAILFAVFICCNSHDKKKEAAMLTQNLKEENITYTDGKVNMHGYVVYDENIKGKRPGVIVIHEWWGLNDYPKKRARQLAGLGYIAMAIDMYGDGKTADNPTDAGNLSSPFYSDLAMSRSRFEAALNKFKSYPQVDRARIAAIGYCFGGSQVLNMANTGEDLKAVVSFHGGLQVAGPDKAHEKAAILVCHGAADPFVPQDQVTAFKKMMDSAGISYEFKAYPGALHAFSNPAATENGKKFNLPIRYDPAADTASWNDMKEFFSRKLN
jgi:dienelactone hydrolase